MLDPSARIRKLLDLARDQAGTPEGDAAARIARRLMLRHARTHAAAACAGIPDSDPIRRWNLELGGDERWRRRLATSVARHCACIAAWRRGGSVARFFGHTSAQPIVEYLYVVLSREVEEAGARWLREEAPALTQAEAERDPENLVRLRDFSQSAVTALDNRLAEMRATERGEDPTGTALVVARGRDVRKWMEDEGVQLDKSPRRPWRHSPAGWEAGARIGFHEAVRKQGDLPGG
jgi:hypothetical protein